MVGGSESLHDGGDSYGFLWAESECLIRTSSINKKLQEVLEMTPSMAPRGQQQMLTPTGSNVKGQTTAHSTGRPDELELHEIKKRKTVALKY